MKRRPPAPTTPPARKPVAADEPLLKKGKLNLTNRTISCELSRTVNLGNYESLRFQLGMAGEIPESADHLEEYDALVKEVHDLLKEHIGDVLDT